MSDHGGDVPSVVVTVPVATGGAVADGNEPSQLELAMAKRDEMRQEVFPAASAVAEVAAAASVPKTQLVRAGAPSSNSMLAVDLLTAIMDTNSKVATGAEMRKYHELLNQNQNVIDLTLEEVRDGQDDLMDAVTSLRDAEVLELKARAEAAEAEATKAKTEIVELKAKVKGLESENASLKEKLNTTDLFKKAVEKRVSEVVQTMQTMTKEVMQTITKPIEIGAVKPPAVAAAVIPTQRGVGGKELLMKNAYKVAARACDVSSGEKSSTDDDDSTYIPPKKRARGGAKKGKKGATK